MDKNHCFDCNKVSTTYLILLEPLYVWGLWGNLQSSPRTFILFFKFKKIKKLLIQFLKVTLHLQLLQNIGYIPHVVQYMLVAYLTPDSLYLPLHQLCIATPSPLVTTDFFSIPVSLLIFILLYSLICCIF